MLNAPREEEGRRRRYTTLIFDTTPPFTPPTYLFGNNLLNNLLTPHLNAPRLCLRFIIHRLALRRLDAPELALLVHRAAFVAGGACRVFDTICLHHVPTCTVCVLVTVFVAYIGPVTRLLGEA